MFDVINDDIVAISTAPGFALRGIVRCSGPRVLAQAQFIFRCADGGKLATAAGFRREFGVVELEPECHVPGEVYLFRTPRSYTRQDCVEFHVPGSPAVLHMLVERLLGLGARAAEPGEFTARAFLSGAMNLTRAESVAALIRARSDAQLEAARRLADGRLVREIESIVSRLAELAALVEANIDFAEESIEFITPAELRERLSTIRLELGTLLEAADAVERLDVLPRILLVGRSNAGKSTLMNRLSGIDRAICSPVPGTTRDVLSAPIRLGRGEAVLLDAAGVDAQAEGLLRQAASLTLAAADKVDLRCIVVDLSAAPDRSLIEFGDARSGAPTIVVGSKSDLLDAKALAARTAWLESAGLGPVAIVSAKTGEGIDACRQTLTEALHGTDTGIGADVLVISARHREAIGTAMECLSRCAIEAHGIGATIDRADLLAFELREALDSLGTVAGSVTTEDLLGRVFASFCIGK